MLVRSEQCRSAFVRFNYNHNLNALMSEPTLVGRTKVEFERREKSIFANERYLNIKYTNTKKTSLATISSFRRIQKFSISLKSFKNIRVFLITVNMPTSFHLMMMKKKLLGDIYCSYLPVFVVGGGRGDRWLVVGIHDLGEESHVHNLLSSY